KPFGSRAENRDHLGARSARGLIASLIGHQYVKFAAWVTADAAQHLIGADHLRNSLRRNEGPDLDRVKSGAEQGLDKRDARFDADRRLLVLKAVARADFDDAHLVVHGSLPA